MKPLHIDHATLELPRLPAAFEAMRVLHLSDLHLTHWIPRMEKTRKALSELRPDLAVITGDLGHRSWRWRQSLPAVLRLLEPIQAPLGTYFILGNHDSPQLGAELSRHGMRMLTNESVVLTRRGQRVALIGLAQHKRIDTDIPAALTHTRTNDFKLMLMHYPDLIFAAGAAGADVCLAGHTHGGQICYPDGSPIMGHDALSPQQCSGVHKINGTWLVVNRGVGKAGVRLRLFCPPHAILLTFTRGWRSAERSEISEDTKTDSATRQVSAAAPR